MNAILSVDDCKNYTAHDALSGTVRNYFLSAETEIWDYAPSGLNMYDGGSLTDPSKCVLVQIRCSEYGHVLY